MLPSKPEPSHLMAHFLRAQVSPSVVLERTRPLLREQAMILPSPSGAPWLARLSSSSQPNYPFLQDILPGPSGY